MLLISTRFNSNQAHQDWCDELSSQQSPLPSPNPQAGKREPAAVNLGRFVLTEKKEKKGKAGNLPQN
jgi:hypothetical protein